MLAKTASAGRHAAASALSVSAFFSSDPNNYFSVELDEDGEIEMTWGATSRGDALIGVTEGGGAADPRETDLSRADDDDDDH